MNTQSTAKVSFPFFGILGLIFITLKLTGYVSWSWWLVLMPLWAVPVGLLSLFLLWFTFVFLFFSICGFVENIRNLFKKTGR